MVRSSAAFNVWNMELLINYEGNNKKIVPDQNSSLKRCFLL